MLKKIRPFVSAALGAAIMIFTLVSKNEWYYFNTGFGMLMLFAGIGSVLTGLGRLIFRREVAVINVAELTVFVIIPFILILSAYHSFVWISFDKNESFFIKLNFAEVVSMYILPIALGLYFFICSRQAQKWYWTFIAFAVAFGYVIVCGAVKAREGFWSADFIIISILIAAAFAFGGYLLNRFFWEHEIVK